MGGDFVGLSATFHPQTGAFIPIPEYMIPKSLLQWGQAPTSLQVFTSEDVYHTDGGSSPPHLRRQTWTMYPETDCGMENIQTHRVAPVHQFVEHTASNRLTTNNNDNSARRRRIDLPSITTRAWSCHPATAAGESNTIMLVESAFVAFAKNDDQHRVRIAVEIEIFYETCDDANSHNTMTPSRSSACRYRVVSPVKIVLERQLNSVATFGAHFTKGAGLDAAPLTRWMGPILPLHESFAINPILGKWRRNVPSSEGMSQLTEVVFPGHVTLSYGSMGTLWILEMGQVVPEDQIQHMARLSFSSPTAVEIETWVELVEIAT